MSLETAKHNQSDVSALLAAGNSGPTPPPASPEAEQAAARRRSRQSLLASRFSNVVGVLMRDTNFRKLRLADLEWLVIPPILAGQCRLAHTSMPAGATLTQRNDILLPVAVALWASVSTAIDARLAGTIDKPVELGPTEWKSGDNLWLMAIAGDPRAFPTFLGQLESQDFKGKTVKLRSRRSDGQTEILTLGAYRERMSAVSDPAKNPAPN